MSAFSAIVLATLALLAPAMPAAAQSLKAELIDIPTPAPGPPPSDAARADMLPDGVVSHATGTIRAAWLTRPTGRYAHAVIGDAIEAAGLAVQTDAGRTIELTLDEDAVFEDRYARIVTLDGTEAVLAVKSTRTRAPRWR